MLKASQISYKRVLIAAGLGTCLALSSAVMARANDVQPGKSAPDFMVRDTAGKEVKLSSLRGKTVVLEWTNHQCP